jgi:transcription antitermination factor NusG
MDVLKYCFGIDLARDDVERIQRKKRKQWRRLLVQRYIYVNAPATEQGVSTVAETVV